MKFRTFIVPLAIVAGLILVLGLGLLGGFALRNPLYLLDRGGQALPEALVFVPQQSPIVLSVLARPDRFGQLWQYLAPPQRRHQIQADITQLEQALLADTGLSYRRDIQPWLGEEITAAVVSPDVDQDPTNGVTPGYLVVLSCRDSQTARSTLELFWQNRALAGAPLTFEDRAGSRLIYAQDLGSGDSRGNRRSNFQQLSTALVANHFVLVANHPEVLRQALTAAQTEDGHLSASPRYRTALKALPPRRVGLLALNLPATNHWLGGNLGDGDGFPLLGDLDSPEPGVDWGLISFTLDRQGIMADAAWIAALGHRLQPHQDRFEDWYSLARFLPTQLAFAALGQNWADLRQTLQPFLTLLDRPNFTQLTPLPLDGAFGRGATQQLLAGLDQPFSLGLALSTPTSPPHWLLVTPLSDPLAATVASLDDLAQAKGLGVAPVTIFNHPTTAWTRLSILSPGNLSASTPAPQIQAEITGLHAQLGEHVVLSTAAGVMEQALGSAQAAPAPSSWTQQLDRFKQPSQAYLHVDWPQLQDALQQQVPQFRLWETIARPLLKHLRQITVAQYRQTDQVQTMGLFLHLGNPE
ncbi:MAG TPA: DUF3352 domain-containing protein [Leptolyngbyaceae cyanobacterium M65_K2018_010]|nr:DUF3352 domain-containing protein [Leptolyngbyaceae cyanobacterium M65_K2018_010]